MGKMQSVGIAGALAMMAGGVWWIWPDPAPRGDHCAAQGFADLCRIEGAPLQMSGIPVFLPPKQQAFFPTSGALRFVDARGMEWIAPPGTLTDGASIPLPLAPLIGDRQSREFILAAALHDAYCGIGNDTLETYQARTWEAVHRMFYDALVSSGTPPGKARIMFAAVYLGGPRWNDPARDLSAVPVADLIQEMQWCLEWIKQTDPTPQQIETWMIEREALLRAGQATAPRF